MLQRLLGVNERPLRSVADFESLQQTLFFREKKAVKKIKNSNVRNRGTQNSLLLDHKRAVAMVPHNTGMPLCPLVWYQEKDGCYTKVLDNQDDFIQIQNLSEILDRITDVMVESYDTKQILQPFLNFGIRLTDEIEPNYSGSGELILLTGIKLSPKARKDPEGARVYFANEFLDKFIGWNFGDVIKGSEELESKLLEFNSRLIIDKNRTSEAPTGFDVSYRGREDCFYKFER